MSTTRSRTGEHLSGLLVTTFRSMPTVNTPEAFVALNPAFACEALRHG